MVCFCVPYTMAIQQREGKKEIRRREHKWKISLLACFKARNSFRYCEILYRFEIIENYRNVKFREFYILEVLNLNCVTTLYLTDFGNSGLLKHYSWQISDFSNFV